MDGGRGLPDGHMGPSATLGQAEPKSKRHLLVLQQAAFAYTPYNTPLRVCWWFLQVAD